MDLLFVLSLLAVRNALFQTFPELDQHSPDISTGVPFMGVCGMDKRGRELWVKKVIKMYFKSKVSFCHLSYHCFF